MNTTIDKNALDRTLSNLTERLLSSRVPQGHWRGRLSGSALSTAVAVFALSIVDRTKFESLIRKGLNWLTENQNPDGGWGDTVISISNIATTMLCYSALSIDEESDHNKQVIAKAQKWLGDFAVGLEPDKLAKAVDLQYGKDLSFSAPILTMCALAGRLGDGGQAWQLVKPLPFELAVFPHKFFKWLRLPVVSYAMPALIAIGQANYHHRKPVNPISRLIRCLSLGKTLNVLGKLQPTNGGFLEAVPLTSFVVMSLAASEQEPNEVVQKGTCFLVNSARDDGSWPIDTDLATWLTTLSINTLNENPDFINVLPLQDHKAVRDWLLGSQYRQVHPYTNAAPGGWAWTDLPGAVPDADDTSGVLIALKNLGPSDDEVKEAATAGIKWLMGLQNRDGGIPTFCRGWTAQAFDRSAPDITAHALGAMGIWFDELPAGLRGQVNRTISRALSYLQNAQKQDGSWIPLWFGNQYEPHQENPLYGTARTLSVLSERFRSEYLTMTERAVTWLLSNQNTDGGWGGAREVSSSIEETALAVDALATRASSTEIQGSALAKGTSWLIEHTEAGTLLNPSPIGLYFARLWYYEELYPLIFATSALQKVKNLNSM